MLGNIKIQNIDKSFDDVKVLNDFTLDIEPGTFVSLIGPSGCGKSTLLRIIGGLEQSTSGDVFLDGEKVTKAGSDRGFAFQGSNLFPWLNVRENVAFGLKARKIYREKKNDVSDIINLVGLKGFENSYPHQISGGMQQRASLARARVGHPKVLLLDEPLGALDAFTRMNLQDEILRIKNENDMTMLMVTHDVDEAIYMSDRVVVMSARPSRLEAVIDIDLPRPRVRVQDAYTFYRNKILDCLNLGGKLHEAEYNI